MHIAAVVIASWVALSGSQGPSSDAWRYAQTITLDTTAAGANVPDDVEHYPLAVRLDKSRFDFRQARADGADIRFVDAGGKALPHAIELWDREAGTAAIWVLLDRVKGNSRDQSIVMKWGHPSTPDISDAKAVFKRAHGFAGVWHLGEDGNTTPDGYKDSSEHEAHGTGVGLIAGSRVDARIGKGTHLDNPAGQDTARWIRVTGEKAAQFNPGGPITVSIWALGYSYPIRSYETIIAKGDTSWTLQRVQYGPGGGAQKIGGQGYQTCVRTPPTHACAYNFAGQGLVTKEWLHFMVVFEEPVMKLYINGKLNATESAGPWNKGDHDLGIGNQTQHLGGRRQWDGILDEARVMQVARGASWAKLDYESQRETPTLLKFGETRTIGAPAAATAPRAAAAPSTSPQAANPHKIVYRGTTGAGVGKHIVFLAGDHEYRSEESLPQLARMLAKHYGFTCTVLITIDPKTGFIEPGSSDMSGLDVLRSADLLVVFLRFQDFPDAEMQHIVDYLDRGGPIVAFRTATHAFQIKRPDAKFLKYTWNNKDASYVGGFGRQILGETWVSHYGANHKQSSRLVLQASQASHPILRGVKDVWVQSGGYTADPIAGSQVLADGQILNGMTPDSPPAEDKKLMPVAWVRTYQGTTGRSGRVFTTTHGASEDLLNEGFRRMAVNACLWAAGLENSIRPDGDVSLVGPYAPTTFAFNGFVKGMKPSDMAGWDTPIPKKTSR